MTTVDFVRAAIDAARQGEDVMYQCAGWTMAEYRFREAEALVNGDGGELPSKVYLARGNQRIQWANGGRIIFHGTEPRGFRTDLHIIDGDVISSWPVADRVLQ